MPSPNIAGRCDVVAEPVSERELSIGLAAALALPSVVVGARAVFCGGRGEGEISEAGALRLRVAGIGVDPLRAVAVLACDLSGVTIDGVTCCSRIVDASRCRM